MLGRVEGKASNRKKFSTLTFTLSLRLNLCKTANLSRVIIVGTSHLCGGGKKSGFFSVTSLIDEFIHLFFAKSWTDYFPRTALRQGRPVLHTFEQTPFPLQKVTYFSFIVATYLVVSYRLLVARCWLFCDRLTTTHDRLTTTYNLLFTIYHRI